MGVRTKRENGEVGENVCPGGGGTTKRLTRVGGGSQPEASAKGGSCVEICHGGPNEKENNRSTRFQEKEDRGIHTTSKLKVQLRHFFWGLFLSGVITRVLHRQQQKQLNEKGQLGGGGVGKDKTPQCSSHKGKNTKKGGSNACPRKKKKQPCMIWGGNFKRGNIKRGEEVENIVTHTG